MVSGRFDSFRYRHIQNGRSTALGDTFNRDGYHLELTYGRYTAACTWFETLDWNRCHRQSLASCHRIPETAYSLRSNPQGPPESLGASIILNAYEKNRICLAGVAFRFQSPVRRPIAAPGAYDGVSNVIDGTFLGGFNVVTGWFVGESGTYTRHLTGRWSVSAGEQVQLFKQLYSLDVMGTYRLPIGRTNLYFDGRLLFNRYDRWNVNEPIVNLSAYWETSYVDLRLGESLVRYHKIGVMRATYLSYIDDRLYGALGDDIRPGCQYPPAVDPGIPGPVHPQFRPF